MNGVLVVDKPEGMTSHDVVAMARRALRQRQIGHTGTLDPLATGVLPLACGTATRLVRFLMASDKDYEATIQFGLSTDTYDIQGRERTRSGLVPSRDAVLAALEPLRGEYLQMPPPYSAKKVGGERAYALARRDEAVTLTAVPVRVTRAELLDFTGDSARIALTCSSGFYVRSLAHSLGEAVGTGGCLAALRRTRSGEFGIEQAVSVTELQASSAAVAERWIPLERLLPALPALRLSEEGRRRVGRGQDVGADHLASGQEMPAGIERSPEPDAWFRLFDEDGRLISLATLGGCANSFHPAIVLLKSSV